MIKTYENIILNEDQFEKRKPVFQVQPDLKQSFSLISYNNTLISTLKQTKNEFTSLNFIFEGQNLP